MTAPDEVKAGKYELVVLFWEQPKSKAGEPYDYVRHVQGDVVDLNVEEARRLVRAGAVVKPGELKRQAAEAARLAYQQSLAALPADLREQVAGDVPPPPAPAPSIPPGGTSTPPPPAASLSPSPGERPAGRASLEVWSEYAVTQGATVEELEGLSRDEIRALYPQA